MKTSARYQTVIDIFDILNKKSLPMDLLIGDYMRNRRFIGSKDRKFIVELTYDMARAHARLGWWMTHTKSEDTPRQRVLAYLHLCNRETTDTIKDLFNGEKYAPEALTKEDFTLLKAIEGESLDLSLIHI